MKVDITDVGATALYEMLKTQFDIIYLPLTQNDFLDDGELYRNILALLKETNLTRFLKQMR